MNTVGMCITCDLIEQGLPLKAHCRDGDGLIWETAYYVSINKTTKTADMSKMAIKFK